MDVVALVISHVVAAVLGGVLVGLAMQQRQQAARIPGIVARLSPSVRELATAQWREQIASRQAARAAVLDATVAQRKAIELGRAYGRASQTIGGQRVELVALRAAVKGQRQALERLQPELVSAQMELDEWRTGRRTTTEVHA